MNLKNQPPVFVPFKYITEMEKLSKAALMDMVWDYALQSVGSSENEDEIMQEFIKRREIILIHRKNLKKN